jgi:hypothetical protein
LILRYLQGRRGLRKNNSRVPVPIVFVVIPILLDLIRGRKEENSRKICILKISL